MSEATGSRLVAVLLLAANAFFVAAEFAIIKLRASGVSERLARAVATAVAALRELDLIKPPGAAEAIDWAQALAILGAESVNGEEAVDTLGWALKNHDDLRRVERVLPELLPE